MRASWEPGDESIPFLSVENVARPTWDSWDWQASELEECFRDGSRSKQFQDPHRQAPTPAPGRLSCSWLCPLPALASLAGLQAFPPSRLKHRSLQDALLHFCQGAFLNSCSSDSKSFLGHSAPQPLSGCTGSTSKPPPPSSTAILSAGAMIASSKQHSVLSKISHEACPAKLRTVVFAANSSCGTLGQLCPAMPTTVFCPGCQMLTGLPAAQS